VHTDLYLKTAITTAKKYSWSSEHNQASLKFAAHLKQIAHSKKITRSRSFSLTNSRNILNGARNHIGAVTISTFFNRAG